MMARSASGGGPKCATCCPQFADLALWQAPRLAPHLLRQECRHLRECVQQDDHQHH